MRRFLPYILIVFTLVNFLAPVSIGLSEKNRVVVEKREASAENGIKVQVTTWTNSTTVRVNVAVLWESNNWFTKQIVQVELKDMAGTLIENKEVTMKDSPDGNNNQAGVVDFTKNILPDTQYQVFTSAVQASASVLNLFSVIGTPDVPNISVSGKPTPDPLIAKTAPVGADPTKLVSSGTQSSTNSDGMPVCMDGLIPQVGGCFAQLIYYALFVPTSYLFALAGNFFDWTFAYSVNDASYRSGFVVQGWGVVRDFCNMFFIFILLYVAFTTILGTQDAKTKDMIVHVIIIGLLINFSLFATQVIIDASNILARVFYNSNTIVITPSGSTIGQTGLGTTPSDPAGTGIIPLSAALVNKINPQNLIINANSVNDFSTESRIGAAQNATDDKSLSAGRFIIVTLLAIAVNVVGFVVFITVAMLFVGRVVMLWIAMILSPAVFFTYMVPKLKNMEMIGWTKWWPETISLAFLAPVFIFFLYLILKFLETKIVFIDSTGKTGIQMVIAVMVPFVFIMVLLLKSKEIATKMAGKMGEMAAKAGSAVSGLALGAATGGAALAMRGTIGKYASGVANDEELKKKADAGSWSAKMKLRAANYGSKASYDVRNTAAGKAAGKELGVDLDKQASWVGLGTKNTKDGYAGGLKRKGERDAKDSENLKQSVSAGADQDDKAKKWNADYNDDLVNKKTAWESDPQNKGKIFDEGKHKREYERDNGAKVRTSVEENKKRFADKASNIEYGEDYVKNRDEAKEQARLAATPFNEGAWRKTKNINKRTNLSDRENLAVKDLRSKSDPEKPPLNAVERSNATKSITKAQTAYDNAHTEIERVETKLQDIAGPGNSTENLSKTDIDTYIATNHTPKLMTANAEISQLTALMNSGNVSNNDIIKADAEITRLTALMNTNPGNPNLQKDLATAQMNRKSEVGKEIVKVKKKLVKQNLTKKQLDDEIRDLNSMLSNRINQQSIKTQQSSIIKEKNDDLARG